MQYLSLGETYWSRKKADFYLWTIRRQHHISATIRTQLMSAVSVVLLLSILLPIRLETALHVIFYSRFGSHRAFVGPHRKEKIMVARHSGSRLERNRPPGNDRLLNAKDFYRLSSGPMQ